MNNRLNIIKDELDENKLDAVLISSVPNIAYLTGYSGFSKEEREALLLITQNNNYILTDKRYRDEIKNIIYSSSEQSESRSNEDSSRPASQQGGQARAINIFQLEEVSSSIPFRLALEKLAKKHKIKKLGIEDDDLTVSEYKSLKRCFIGLNHWSITDFRSVKENDEIASIEKACELTDKTFEYILTKIKKGITEKELAFEIEFFIKKNGGDLAFSPIVAFGNHSAIPHHKVTDKKLGANEIILLDFGAKVPASPSQGGDNYCSDMTRVVFLGKATREQKKVYQIVLDAQKRAIDHINNFYSSSERKESRSLNSSRLRSNNNIIATDVDKVAHDYIREKGFGENIFHSLGHGVGLEIHESPHLSSKSKEILKPGMVFTIEPGIYLPEKFGVRIEDLAVLEKSGLRLLSKSPKNIIEL